MTESHNEQGSSKVAAVVLAAGTSTRYGRDKLDETFLGRALWRLSLDAFLQHPLIDEVVLVGPRDPGAGVVRVNGGTTRQDSARAGVEATGEDVALVLVHDGARPFVDFETISRVVHAGLEHSAAYPAVPVTDTIRMITPEGSSTPNRAALWAVQTPQAGHRADLLRAYAASVDPKTDDVGALEAIGIEAFKVDGDPRNTKVTHTSDLCRPVETRTGIGYDIHRFSTDPTRAMWLGGIEFPEDKPGLDGHSDADALIHAVVDALLGAANMGDIGVHFRNDDPRWKNMPSSHFLAQTGSLLRGKNWHIINIDATVLAERPKIMGHRDSISAAIAKAVGVDIDRVSVKATTNEALGAIGRGEGVAALATATLVRAL